MTAPLTDLDLPETMIFDDDQEPATIRCSAAGPWGRSGVRVIGDRLILLAGAERADIGLDQIERWSVTSQDALAVLRVSVGGAAAQAACGRARPAPSTGACTAPT